MSLDLNKVAVQVTDMVAELRSSSSDRQERLNHALNTMRAVDHEKLKQKIAASRKTVTWLVAGITEEMVKIYPVPPCPADFTVLATDGSHIDIDRHRAARCYLINIGAVKLTYGSQPDADLTSMPHLYAGDKDMVIAAEGTKGREQTIESTLLGIKRSVAESEHLTVMGGELPAGSVALGLMDGSLILWGLSGKDYPDFVVESLLDKGMIPDLEKMRQLNIDRRFAVASYISFPRGSDVTNALRIAVCPHAIVKTDSCPTCSTRECDRLAGIQDRDLFTVLLQKGERSALFMNQSKIMDRYQGHRVYFFYLNVEEEIARVEIPEWVAGNKELLGLTHSLIVDQCRRGHGYPVALSESHEQAVVTGTDREYFWNLVESTLVEEHMPVTGSVKSLSKRTRWV